MNDNHSTEREETAVDDVRRVREQLQRESGGDIGRHIEQSNRVLDEYREKLALKVVQPPPSVGRRTGTGG